MQRHMLLLTPYLEGYSDRTGNITCLLRNISCLWIGHIWFMMKINVKAKLIVSTQFIKCRLKRCRNLGYEPCFTRLAMQIREKLWVCPLRTHCSWHQPAQFTYANGKIMFDSHQAFHRCCLLIYCAPLVINFDVQFNVSKMTASKPLFSHLWEWI